MDSTQTHPPLYVPDNWVNRAENGDSVIAVKFELLGGKMVGKVTQILSRAAPVEFEAEISYDNTQKSYFVGSSSGRCFISQTDLKGANIGDKVRVQILPSSKPGALARGTVVDIIRRNVQPQMQQPQQRGSKIVQQPQLQPQQSGSKIVQQQQQQQIQQQMPKLQNNASKSKVYDNYG